MNCLIHKLTLALLLSLGLLGVFSPTQVGGQTGPLATTSANTNWPAEASKVHLILAGLTTSTEHDIGPECRADLVAVQSLFSKAFLGEWRTKLVIHPLYGETWTAVKVRQYLKEMNVGPNDVLVFFHSGHGSIQNASQPVETQNLQIEGRDSLRREELRSLLLARKSRGVIVLTDCCSTLVSHGIKSRSPATRQPGLASFNQATIRNLFLRFQGLVDITAAEVGDPSLAINHLNDFGGARSEFTVAFLKLACEAREFTTWGDFFPALRELTATASGKRHRAHAYVIREETAGSTQTPPAVKGPMVGTVTGPLAK